MHAKGNAMIPMLRGTSMTLKKATPVSTRMTATSTATMTSSLASWKLPKLYLPRYRAKLSPTTSWAMTATAQNAAMPGTLTSFTRSS